MISLACTTFEGCYRDTLIVEEKLRAGSLHNRVSV